MKIVRMLIVWNSRNFPVSQICLLWDLEIDGIGWIWLESREDGQDSNGPTIYKSKFRKNARKLEMKYQ